MTASGEGTTDAELVRFIAAAHAPGSARSVSSSHAEAELCRRFAPRIRLYGLKHLRDEERARDLVQAVLLAVLEAARADRVEDAERIDRFVLGTCRNASMRMRQIDTRATPVPDEDLDVSPFLQGVDFVDAGALAHCLSALDQRGRLVVSWSFYEERSAEEIARTLETTAGNVRVLRHRAIAALRRCLDDAGAPDGGHGTHHPETSS
jgi:RNA polymerase sigma-70 factor (ECF subfamily)